MSFDRFDNLMRQMESMRAELDQLRQPPPPVCPPPPPPPPPPPAAPTRDALPGGLRQTLDSHVDVVVAADRNSAVYTHRLRIEFASDRRGAQWAAVPLVSSEHVVLSKHVFAFDDAGVPEHFFAIDNGEHQLFVLCNGTAPTRFTLEFSVYAMIGKQFKTHAITAQSNTPFESMTLRFVDRAEFPVEDLQVSVRAVVHDNGTDAITVHLISTTNVEINWRAERSVVVDTPDNATVASEIPSATLETLFSVADDNIQGFTTISYALDDGNRHDHFEIALFGSNLRVASVVGLGMESWHITNNDQADGVVVHVQLRSPVQTSTYRLVVRTEARVAESDTFELPVIKPLMCSRVHGRIGVATSKNTVEIGEVSAAGVATIADRDFSPELKMQSNRPILLAYSFVHADVSVRLRRIVHHIVDVVVPAFVEHLHEAVHVDVELSMHILRGTLVNSNRQFLTVSLPESLENVWSVGVNSNAVSPSTLAQHGGKKNRITIPLLSTLSEALDDDDGDGHRESSFEIVFLTRNANQTGGQSGVWSTTLSQVDDIPVTLHTAAIRFPVQFDTEWQSAKMQRTTAAQQSPTPKQVTTKRRASHIVEYGDDVGFNEKLILEEHMSRQRALDVELPAAGFSVSTYHFQRKLFVTSGQDVSGGFIECSYSLHKNLTASINGAWVWSAVTMTTSATMIATMTLSATLTFAILLCISRRFFTADQP